MKKLRKSQIQKFVSALKQAPKQPKKKLVKVLKKYGVTSIELGAQSMDDQVLKMNDRGHSSLCVEKS